MPDCRTLVKRLDPPISKTIRIKVLIRGNKSGNPPIGTVSKNDNKKLLMAFHLLIKHRMKIKLVNSSLRIIKSHVARSNFLDKMAE